MILVIGDSNLVGSFGDSLHKEMASWKEADVISIAIGGGNASYYNRTMKNVCCGFKVRSSSKNSTAVSAISSSGKKTSAVILPEYNGNLFALIDQKKPTMIVIALGSNADSNANHNTLVNKINKYNPDLPIYWIGPPDASNINATRADAKIQGALESTSIISISLLFKSEGCKESSPRSCGCAKMGERIYSRIKRDSSLRHLLPKLVSQR